MLNRGRYRLLGLAALTAFVLFAVLNDGSAASKRRKKTEQFHFSPWRLWGSTGLGYNRSMAQNKKPVEQIATTTNLTIDKGVNGYLFKPWMATWNAGSQLGVVATKSNTDNHEEFGLSNSTDTISKNAGGNISLSIMPVSQFPVKLMYSYTISDGSEGTLGGDAKRNYKWGFNQTFRSDDGDLGGAFSYDRTTDTSGSKKNSGIGVIPDLRAETDRSVSEMYRTNVTKKIESHNLGFSGTLDKSEVKNKNDLYTLRNHAMVVNHDVSESGFLSVNNIANLGVNRMNNEPVGEAANTQTNAQTQWRQFSNTVSWRSEEHPLSMVVSSRAYRSDTNTAAPGSGIKDWTGTESWSSTVSTNYQVNESMMLGVAVGGNRDLSHSPGSYDWTHAANQSLNASYSPGQVELGEYAYRWNVTSSLNNAVADGTTPRVSSGESGSHSISRTFRLPEESSIAYSLSEGINASYARKAIPGYTVNHSISGVYSSADAVSNSLAGLSLSESRHMVDAHDRTYVTSLQLTRASSDSESENLTGSVNWQWSWNRDEQAEKTENSSTGIDVNYQNRELFSVPSLRYSSRVGLTNDGLVPLFKDGMPDGYNLNNRIEYQIGLLTVGMTCDMAENRTRDVTGHISSSRSALYLLEIRRFFNLTF